jgi:hypothetical protein
MTDTSRTVTLADFLMARIAEDEAAAQSAADPMDRIGDGMEVWDGKDWRQFPDPARVLAECKAKKKIVERWEDPFGEWSAEQAEAARKQKEAALRHLALPFADHPEYREEWRP